MRSFLNRAFFSYFTVLHNRSPIKNVWEGILFFNFYGREEFIEINVFFWKIRFIMHYYACFIIIILLLNLLFCLISFA